MPLVRCKTFAEFCQAAADAICQVEAEDAAEKEARRTMSEDELRAIEAQLREARQRLTVLGHLHWTDLATAELLLAEVRRLGVLVAEEREACARVADEAADRAYRRFEALGHDHTGRDMTECLEGRNIAAAIRARGQS